MLTAMIFLWWAANGQPTFECTYDTSQGSVVTYEVGGCGELDTDDND